MFLRKTHVNIVYYSVKTIFVVDCTGTKKIIPQAKHHFLEIGLGQRFALNIDLRKARFYRS